MANKRTEICKETCFVIDHCTPFLEDSGAKLELDASSKNRNAPSFLSTLQKTTWTCIVEGVIEYCRIIYDIFTPAYKIFILCSDENAYNVNEVEDQNIQQILKGFGDLGPPKESYDSTTSVFHGVAEATEDLLKRAPENTPKTSKRLIVITTIEDESDAGSISNVVWELQNTQDKNGLVHIDLLVVNITTKGDEISSPKRQVSPNLDVTTVTFHSKTCSIQIPMLTRKHYYLKSTIITGIPMKEEQHAGTSANYDVEIIHSAAAHHDSEWLHALENMSDHQPLNKSSVTLKWCTPKANSLQDIQPCIGIYRVTPSEVNSRPAACLIMFLLQGRTVMLEQPKKSGAKVLTHMLNSHGGDIYIHVLVSGRSHFEDPPSIAEGIGGRVTDYRVNDFGRFMEENRLAPYANVTEEDSSVSPNKKSMNRLERYSKYWPLVICDTFIFNMYTNLEPLLSLLLKPELNEDEVQECKKVIYKLQAMESRSDTLPLPIVTLKGKGSKKEDQYKQVWTELDMFIEGASLTSPMHKKVLNCLRGDQETSLPTDPIVTVKELRGTGIIMEKLRTDQERDRKTVKEAPSDPRRRRRTSETSSAIKETTQTATTPKKSPRTDDPPAKMRRSGSRNAINTITPNVQMKSSLLSIFTNHMNLTGSRFHEEFLGRKMAVDGKYELYQADVDPTGQNEQKTLPGKVGKDTW